MVNVRILYFAVLRDIAGKGEELIELADGSRARDVWQLLRDRYETLRDYAQPPMVAVNESYVSADQRLEEGDELAFIPPVAGG
jgi:molybdopterin converting factor subunit 1